MQNYFFVLGLQQEGKNICFYFFLRLKNIFTITHILFAQDAINTT